MADVKLRRATARQFHLVQAHKPTPEVIGPLTRKYPAWMKVGIAVGALLLIGSLLYWAASRSRTNGSEGQKPEAQSTQNQAIQPQTTTLPPSVAGAASVGTIEGKVSTGNSVVYADTTTIPRKTFPASAQKAVMDQFRLEFKPHVMVIQQGTTVEFLNSDVVQHNVFWPSIGGKKNEFLNLGTWSKGEKRTYKFDTPGVAELLCNVHPEMSAYIVISPTPYFAETDADGNYKIENVPNGTYIVYAWHEGMKQQHQLVEVAGTSKVDFSLSK